MPAYLIVLQQSPTEDGESLAQYQQLTREMNNPTPVDPKVVYGAIEGLEGVAPEAVVVLEFASMDEARAWYNNEDYQRALPMRLKAAKYQAFIVEGL